MKRQFITLIIVLTVCLSSCTQKSIESKDENLDTNSFPVDISTIAILPFDTAQYWVFKGCKPTDLTNSELTIIEKLLRKCINEYNPVQEIQYKEFKSKFPDSEIEKNNFVIELSRYKRQYIAVTNKKGEKEVWVNCFCDTWDKNWKKGLIFVLDGGNCYFNLKINLTTGKYYEFMVNGNA